MVINKIEIYNLLGQKVIHSINKNNQNEINLSVNHLLKGIYLVKMYVENNIYTKKINID